MGKQVMYRVKTSTTKTENRLCNTAGQKLRKLRLMLVYDDSNHDVPASGVELIAYKGAEHTLEAIDCYFYEPLRVLCGEN